MVSMTVFNPTLTFIQFHFKIDTHKQKKSLFPFPRILDKANSKDMEVSFFPILKQSTKLVIALRYYNQVEFPRSNIRKF